MLILFTYTIRTNNGQNTTRNCKLKLHKGDEVNFAAGDAIVMLEQNVGDEGWGKGGIGEIIGLFPKKLCQDHYCGSGFP